MRRFLKLSAVAAASLFVAAQFVRPNKANPPVVQAQTIEAHVRVTPEVAGIFKRACKDCHSDQTAWPWYARLAPVSWFVGGHVEDGRRHLNFSRWSTYDREQAGWLLGAMCMTAKRGQMPLPSYTQMHRSAKLSARDVQNLCAWSEAERGRLAK